MANLHANILQVGQPERIAECFEMLTNRSARLMNLTDYGIKVGNPADVAVIEATSPSQAVAELREPIAAFKRGKRTVTRRPTELHRPASTSNHMAIRKIRIAMDGVTGASAPTST